MENHSPHEYVKSISTFFADPMLLSTIKQKYVCERYFREKDTGVQD